MRTSIIFASTVCVSVDALSTPSDPDFVTNTLPSDGNSIQPGRDTNGKLQRTLENAVDSQPSLRGQLRPQDKRVLTNDGSRFGEVADLKAQLAQELASLVNDIEASEGNSDAENEELFRY
ncbi:hypothetical protein FI667_g9646, partial [Globisporangium splendens]